MDELDNVAHFKSNVETILNQVIENDEEFMITKNGECIAVLVPIDIYDELLGPL